MELISQLEKRISELEKKVELLAAKLEPDTSGNGDKNAVVARYDFSDENMRNASGWKIHNAEKIESETSLSFSTIRVERLLGVLYDPKLINKNIRMPIDDIKRVHVRLKSNVDASQQCYVKVYFTTEKSTEFSESKNAVGYYTAGRMTDVYIDMKNRYWTGTLTKLRIDPVEALKGSIEIELVELLDTEGTVRYSVDFTKAQSLESTGWEIENATFVSCAGRLIFNVDVLEKKKVFTDPFVVIDNIDVDADKVKYIHIKMRTDIVDADEDDVYMQILFKTKSSNFWTQDKSMRFSYKQGKEIDAYIEVKQLFWKGTVVSLRIDPFEKFEGTAEIKLIELLSDIPESASVNMLKARTRKLEDRFNKTYN